MIITHIRLVHEALGVWNDPAHYVDLMLDPTAGDNGYIIKSHDGFDPSPTDDYIEGFTQGIPLRENAPENKQLSLQIGFVPGPVTGTNASLRSRLYKLRNRRVFVILMNGPNRVAEITGTIRIFDAPIATNVPEAKLTIDCIDGFFVSPTEVYNDTAELGAYPPTIDYIEGDAPTGFEFRFHLTANTGSINVYTIDGRSVAVTYAFLSGDQIIVQTQRKQRRISMFRSAVFTDLTPLISVGSTWPKLFPGENQIQFTPATATMIYLSYFPRFWGV